MKCRKRGIVVSYINTTLTMITGLYLSSFLLRILGDTEYGIYQTAASFANYLILLEFGTGSVITRNLSLCYARGADEETIEKNISTIWIITCLLATLIAVVSIWFYGAFDRIYSQSLMIGQIRYGKKILVVVTTCLIFSFFHQTISGVILAKENYTFTAKLNIAKTLLRVAALTCILLKWRYAIVIAFVDSVLALGLAIYSYLYCKKTYKISFSLRKFDWGICKASLPLCSAIFIQAIVNQANSNVDKFVIGIKMNPESVAMYGIAIYIYSAFAQLTTVPITMYAPQIIKDVSSGTKGKALVDTLIHPSRLIVLIGGSILFGFIAVGKQFITILYGNEYLSVWQITIIIMLPMFVNMANGVLINVLDAINKRSVRSWILLLTTVANIVLTVFWIEHHGMIGAALATAICTCLGQVCLMNVYYSRKMHLPMIYMFKKIFEGIVPFQIAGAILSIMVCAKIQNVYISFGVGALVFIAIVVTGCFAKGKLKQIKSLR